MKDSLKKVKVHDQDTGRKLASLFAVPTFVLFGAGFLVSPASATINDDDPWADEQEEEVEEPEGIELYDTRAETIGNVSGDYIAMQSIASPDLFENIGDGAFPVEWDVYIQPASGVNDNPPIDVFFEYDTGFDVSWEVERCQHEYAEAPNTVDSRDGCGGETQNWGSGELNASNYLDNLTGTTHLQHFNLQNGAFLRITVTPNQQEGLEIGDEIELRIIAESTEIGERVSIGNTSGTGDTQTISSSTEETEDGDNEDPNGEENGTIEDDDELDESPSEEESPTPEETDEPVEETEPPSQDTAPSEEQPATEEEEGLPLYLMIGIVVVLVAIGAGIFYFWKKQKEEDLDEDDDDEYLDDDEEFEDDEDLEDEEDN